MTVYARAFACQECVSSDLISLHCDDCCKFCETLENALA